MIVDGTTRSSFQFLCNKLNTKFNIAIKDETKYLRENGCHFRQFWLLNQDPKKIIKNIFLTNYVLYKSSVG